MEQPLISLIIPVYNRENFITRCINSALSQSYSNIEIIIVDDGSTDSTPSIIKDFSRQKSNIKVVSQPNSGAAEARKAGVKGAKGEYLMFIDSDDWIIPEAVDFLYNKSSEHNLDVAYGMMVQYINETDRINLLHPFEGIISGETYVSHLFDSSCKASSCAGLFKKSLWEHDIYPSKRIPCEDIYCNILLSQFINKIGLYNHPIYYYFYNPNSLTTTMSLSKSHLWESFFDGIRKNLISRNLINKYENILKYWEIDRLAFYYKKLDYSSPWLTKIANYDSKNFSFKYKILHQCIKHKLFFSGLQQFRKIKKSITKTKR